MNPMGLIVRSEPRARRVSARTSSAFLAGFAGLLFMLGADTSRAAQYALVVGINDYQYGSDTDEAGRVLNLQGAENDARLIATSLRAIGVELPDSHVLIGSDATLSAFKQAWQDLLAKSLPGDVLILSYAGHGGQEKERLAPIDESDFDGLDETLMFYDFNPAKPDEGRLVDDELYTMFKQAGDRQIVFVADSCHSGGLTRKADIAGGRSRQGGLWEFDDSLDDLIEIEAEEGENWELLSHVTYLTATDDEALVVREFPINGRAHGALSVSFAEGITGLADTDNDGRVLRRELQDYVQSRVRVLADQLQTPGFAPRSGSAAEKEIVSIASTDVIEPALNDELALRAALPVIVEGGSLPEGVLGAISLDQASLKFVYQHDEIVSYYNTDELMRWTQNTGKVSNRAKARWQMLIDKFRYLRAVDASYNENQPVLKLTTSCEARDGKTSCDREHRVGESVALEFNHKRVGNGAYFVLFNLAGNGALQLLYPVSDADSPEISNLPFVIELDVSEPVGRDDLVSIFCRDDPVALKRSLADNNNLGAPDPLTLNRQLTAADCQVNRLATFSSH